MIDFWVFIGSTYSYLSIMRLAEVERQTGVGFRWRAFSACAIMIEQNNIPFRDKPVKAAYMWRDIGRRAPMYGLKPKLPAPYPLAEADAANLAAIVGEAEGFAPAYIRETYRRWFDEGEPAGAEPNFSASLKAAGQDPERIKAQIALPEIRARYEAQTKEAKALGIFGSPTFVVGRELFWGDDRLDDAMEWAKRGTLARAHHSDPASDPPPSC